jgi:hypothetical protein
MSLESTLTDIIARLRQGRFPNEQAISQGIVLRVLQELGWDTWNTAVVWPEYQTGQGRADFALCHPPSKPAIFIEVKQPGKAEDAVRQALEYAFHTGVPFIVLTDGRTWSFYLPAEQGSYEDRRVYKLDLFEPRPPKRSPAIWPVPASSRAKRSKPPAKNTAAAIAAPKPAPPSPKHGANSSRRATNFWWNSSPAPSNPKPASALTMTT